MAKYDVLINEEYCKGCGICVHFCPRGAIKLSAEFNAKGVNVPVLEDAERCTGCRLCELYCPDLAVAISHNAEHA